MRVTGDWYGLPPMACARATVWNHGPDVVEVRQDVGDALSIPVDGSQVLQGVDNADRLELRTADSEGDQLVFLRFERVPLDLVEGAESIRYIEVEALGPMDDDLRVKVGGVTLVDSRLNVDWYEGRKQVFDPVSGGSQNSSWSTSGFRKVRISDSDARAAGVELVPGLLVEVDLFDGWGGSYSGSSWKLNVGWSDGSVFSEPVDVQGVAGSSVLPADTIPTTPVSVDLAALFPPKIGGPGALYGAVSLGPYAWGVQVWSRSADPAGANDDLVINGSVVFQNNDSDFVNGGVDTLLATVSAGNTWTVDVRNRTGFTDEMGGFGKLSVEPTVASIVDPAYFTTGPHFGEWYSLGSVVIQG